MSLQCGPILEWAFVVGVCEVVDAGGMSGDSVGCVEDQPILLAGLYKEALGGEMQMGNK